MKLCRKCMQLSEDQSPHNCPTPEEQKDTKDLSKNAHNPETNQPIQHK